MSRPRHRFVIPAVALALAAALPLGASPAVAGGSRPQGSIAPTPWDLNGDGYRDLVVGSPFAMKGGHSVGRVYVLWGAEGGLDGAHEIIDYDAMTTVVQAGARFGWSLASCNLNADVYADLVIGAPGHDEGDLANAGMVFAVLGAADGLGSSFVRRTAAELSPEPSAVAGWEFGYAVACGDLWDESGDPDQEIVATMPGATELPGADGERGLWGIIDVAKNGSLQGTGGGTVPMPAGSRFGASMAIGHFRSGKYDDIAFGVPRADVSAGGSTYPDAGRVMVVPGGVAKSRYTLRQRSRSAGVADDRPERGDRFGEVLTVGDLDHDGYDDLVVGVPRENVSGVADAGLVHVFRSRDDGTGLQTDGEIVLTQESAGIPGSSGSADRFGAALAVGDFGGPGTILGAGPAVNGGPHRDLAIGLPGQDVNGDDRAGAAVVIYWLDGSRRTSGNQLWSQDATGVQTAAEPGDAFGAALAAHPLGQGGLASLVVGVPYEDAGGYSNAGQVHVLPGSTGGVSAGADQVWRPDLLNPAAPGSAGARFGHDVE